MRPQSDESFPFDRPRREPGPWGDPRPASDEDLYRALHQQRRICAALLANGSFTPVQTAALEVITDLTAKTIYAHSDDDRAELLTKLARNNLVRTETARRILALDGTPGPLRQALTDLLLRRGETL